VIDGGRIFWVLAGGCVLFVLGTLRWLPETVASHFDASGAPNGWSSRAGYAALLLIIGVFLPLGIVAMVNRLTRRGPGQLNIPAKDYWTRPEHAEEAIRRVRAYMWWLGCIMTGMAAMTHGLVLAAHTRHPPQLSSPGIILVIGAAILALGAWIVGWYRTMRPPTIH
jgi:uncharacterized membrane protein